MIEPVEPTRIYVMREGIETNERDPDANAPCIVVRHADGRTDYTNRVDVLGPSTVVYSRSDPYNDRTRVWVETHASVVVGREQKGGVA